MIGNQCRKKGGYKLDTKYLKMAMEYRNLIDVLMGDKDYADIVLYNGKL